MQTRKSGIMALVLGAAVLGGTACENKTVIPPDVVVVALTIAPKPVPNLAPGQTFPLTAIVTGNTNQAATWSSSNAACVAVNASTGLLTVPANAANNCSAVITAISAADATARDAVSVTVVAGTTPPPPTGNPQITIGSITQFGTILPVNPGNVFGIIDVTANVDVPANSSGTITIDIVNAAGTVVPGGAAICQQTFTAPGASADAVASAVPVPVVCTINTAALGPNGEALLLNGTYRVRATVVANGQTATATSQLLIFNNADVLNMVVRSDQMTRAVDATGLVFYGGSVVVDIRPAIYSATQADPLGQVNSMQIALSTSGAGAWAANTGSWYCGGDPDGDGTAELVDATPGCAVITNTVTAANPTATGSTNLWRATFSAATAVGAGGVGSLEDRAGVTIVPTNVVTVGGNQFPICSPAQAAAGVCFPATFSISHPAAAGVNPVAITAQNPLRLDNLGPRVTNFDLTPATLGCTPLTACYVNDTFVLGPIAVPTAASGGVQTGAAATYSAGGAAGYRNVDFGSDRQTTQFDILTQGGTVLSTNATSTASPAVVAETGTSGELVVRARVTDAVGNVTTVFAGTSATAPTTTITGATQRIGVDRTPPVFVAFTQAQCNAQATTAGFGPTGTLISGACFYPNLVNSTDANEAATTFTVAIRDSAAAPAGPSGFTGTGSPPLVLSTLLYNAANTGGVAVAGVTAACAALDAASSGCTVTVPDAPPHGYYRVRVQVRDASFPGGNVSDSVRVVYLDDEVAPIVAGVTAPSTVIPNASVTFGADMSDNVELGDLLASLGYPLAVPAYYAHAPRKSLGDFGFDVLSSSATAGGAGSFTFEAGTMPASLQSTVVGTGAPNGADVQYANAVNFAVRDMAGRQLSTVCAAPGVDNVTTQGGPAAAAPNGSCLTRENNNIQPNILAGNAGAAPFDFSTLAAFTFTQSAICRNTVAIFEPSQHAPCAAPPAGSTVVTLQAEARGPQGTFANPFPQGVRFYTFDASGRWIALAGTATVQVFDDDVLNVRRFIYTMVTSTAVVPSTTMVRAIGIRNTASGTAGLIADPDQTTP